MNISFRKISFAFKKYINEFNELRYKQKTS